uniref:Uncharacterized protein n=1 Tax=Megaselia scalaris TaxID=36166 RepID=T1H5C0_MEGSC
MEEMPKELITIINELQHSFFYTVLFVRCDFGLDLALNEGLKIYLQIHPDQAQQAKDLYDKKIQKKNKSPRRGIEPRSPAKNIC